MPDLWTFAALQLVALLGGALTGAVALLIGGAGAHRAIVRRLDEAENAIDDQSVRITKEVKQRAGLAGAAKRAQTDAEVRVEAEQRLATERAPQTQGRPSPLHHQRVSPGR